MFYVQHKKNHVQTRMFGVIMPICNRMFCCIFWWYFYIEITLKYEKNVLLSSSRAFSLSTPNILSSIPMYNCETTWKKATKCNKLYVPWVSKSTILCFKLWNPTTLSLVSWGLEVTPLATPFFKTAYKISRLHGL